ncbi:GNAT family N-acetyltransferase [Cryptosporangium arvum]|uniref:GNAT family N-acetyltransferase n=1 Tax=Cryptosporangium arvum TaxID=80871 RepID=UPI00147074E3|nr:GNAT family N-acetyltransferase [Cryptosporangium arvum]
MTANRAYLAPWNPQRDDDYFTIGTQTGTIRTALADESADRSVSLVIIDQDDELLGQVRLNSIIRGAFRSASIGSWVSASHAVRGVATSAVADTLQFAFDELGLHRVRSWRWAGDRAGRRFAGTWCQDGSESPETRWK